MTQVIDQFLVQSGFECEELRRIKYRSFLYLAISITASVAMAFSSLALMAWT